MRQLITTLFILMSAVTFTASGVYAEKSCRKVFEETLFDRAFEKQEIDNFDLLVELENRYNREEFSRPVIELALEGVDVKASELEISYSGSAAQNLEIQKLIEKNQLKKIWYKHPFNTGGQVPYFYKKGKEIMQVFSSASRSLLFSFGGQKYSIRMPTDHPTGPNGETKNEKTDIYPELEIAKNRMLQINAAENLFGQTKDLIMAKEIAIVQKGQESGYIIRSLDFLKNKDRYYMPAFSMEIIGEQIAKRFGKNFEEFWIQKYNQNLGKIKAQLLIHYGLQMDFPHAQNIILELDKNFMPTGRFVLRDIDDMSQYSPVVEAMNDIFQQNGQKQIKIEYKSVNRIKLLWNEMSLRALSKSNYKDDLDLRGKWNSVHTAAFIKELANILGVRAKDIGTTEAEATIALGGTWGAQLIKNYFSQKLKN